MTRNLLPTWKRRVQEQAFFGNWLIVTLVAGVLCCAQAFGQHAPRVLTAREMARQIDSHYNHLHSLSVQFSETYKGMGMERTEHGTLLLAKPGRMRWNYTDPAGKLFVMDGKYGYAYTPGDAQAQRFRATQLDDFRSPLKFLLGHTEIQKELTDLTMTADGAAYRLRGVPRGMEQRVATVELSVTAQGTIQSMRWQEADGATTEFQLQKEETNPPVRPGTFTFQPPEGVVIVDGQAPI